MKFQAGGMYVYMYIYIYIYICIYIEVAEYLNQ